MTPLRVGVRKSRSSFARVPRESPCRCRGSQTVGFWDALSLHHDWWADAYIGIDHGPKAPMIEHRCTQVCGRMFMKNGSLRAGLTQAGIWNHASPIEQPTRQLSDPD